VQHLPAPIELLQRCAGLSDSGIQPDESALRSFVQRIDRYQLLRIVKRALVLLCAFELRDELRKRLRARLVQRLALSLEPCRQLVAFV
jgi:hypothetical protein